MIFFEYSVFARIPHLAILGANYMTSLRVSPPASQFGARSDSDKRGRLLVKALISKSFLRNSPGAEGVAEPSQLNGVFGKDRGIL